MPIIFGHQGITGDVTGTLVRLRSLTASLERFSAGEWPTERELSVSPLLDAFRLGTRSLPCLVGVCDDHPRLEGPLITTSEIWALAPEFGWARTFSRLYRLGEPVHTRNPS